MVDGENSVAKKQKRDDMRESGEAWKTFRDLGAVLGLMIPLGMLFHQALFSGQSLWFKLSFALTVVSLVVAIRCFLWSFRKWRVSERLKTIAVPTISLLLVVCFGAAAQFTVKKPALETMEAMELQKTLIDSFSGFRIGIIGKMKRYMREDFIPSDTELRYQLVRTSPGGVERVYKQYLPSGRKLTFIDGIEPGVYDVRLVFYGLTLDSSGPFELCRKLSHIVSLATPGHDVPVFFEVQYKGGHPIEGVWIEIVGPEGQHIRGEPGYSETTESGRTRKPLWIPPLSAEEKRGYVALIRRGEETVAQEEFRLEGATEFYSKKVVRIMLDTRKVRERRK